MLKVPFFKKKSREEKKSPLETESLELKMPIHVAIIMDGNGRWAQQQNLPRALGHRQGVESLREIVKACLELGIKILTVYAFSTENWKRPRQEVDILMTLLVEYLQQELASLNRQGVKICPIGDIEKLPKVAIKELQKAMETTANNNNLVLNIALNYGGRAEIVQGIRRIADHLENGKLQSEDITEEVIGEYLDTKGIPDPDLLIRPAGEYRFSNFLLWQLAYTEFWFTDTLWPDFRKKHLLEAISAYQCRDRRFGGLRL